MYRLYIIIMYKSKYSNSDETLSLNLSEIEFKPHGNNQNNMIIYSNLINEIAHSIQNSKDILINGINYLVILNYH